jgi:hypothetical protein
MYSYQDIPLYPIVAGCVNIKSFAWLDAGKRAGYITQASSVVRDPR